jgi:hypothetical protein
MRTHDRVWLSALVMRLCRHSDEVRRMENTISYTVLHIREKSDAITVCRSQTKILEQEKFVISRSNKRTGKIDKIEKYSK